MAQVPHFPGSVTSQFELGGISSSEDFDSQDGGRGGVFGGSDSQSSSPSSSSRSGSEDSYSSSSNQNSTRNQRSDGTFAKTFSISTRLRRVVKAPTKTQTGIGILVLLLVLILIAIFLGVSSKKIADQDELHNRKEALEVGKTPYWKSANGGIKGQPTQRREFTFIIDDSLGNPDGVEKEMLVVNGEYPGPTIEFNQGDEVLVTVRNSLTRPTSIHWHGLPQNGTNFNDGVVGVTECGIPPGKSVVYNLNTGDFTGTAFWRAGYGNQATDGLTGGLVVHPRQSNITEKYDEEYLIQVSDLYHDSADSLLKSYLSVEGIGGKPGNEPVPDGVTINGYGQYYDSKDGQHDYTPMYYRLSATTGKSYRLRLANTGTFAPIRFSVDRHRLTVVEVDGVEVQPVTFEGWITIEVGQRYSVILHATESADSVFWMRAKMVTDQFKYSQPDSNQEGLGILRYSETSQHKPTTEPSSDPSKDFRIDSLRPLQPVQIPNPTRTYAVNYDFGKDADGIIRGRLNSTTWKPLKKTTSTLKKFGLNSDGPKVEESSQLVISNQGPEVIDMIINNLSGGVYPFSLHGHRVWIMESGVGTYTGSLTNNAQSTSTSFQQSTNPQPQRSPSPPQSTTYNASSRPYRVTNKQNNNPPLTIVSNNRAKSKRNLSDNSHPSLRYRKRSNVHMKNRRHLTNPQPNSSSTIMLRDTFTLPKDGWIRVRFLSNNPGIWLFSDQNLWHLSSGSALQISSMISQQSKIPDQIQLFCNDLEP
ncbi:multi-copper oxidase laccase-like protein [Phakopsora pachyrhizi]|uniref:Multi-copper oxidase laccase-like protein n=1 Tax=Phakopsora pachyrhizi TaxID=170000 RepID=A0AAV0BSU1_PHAPC|nr:multi-copper oxidase laccase-like protein [Phakopsora pachyrhizi]CAH7689888.1 multi-copper oxidase laccase-like protein [Phakopsora pachyrhizi]